MEMLQGARVALVGANGQGKSTLVRLILGELSPESGDVRRHPQAKIGVFAQNNVERLVIVRAGTSALAYMKELNPEGDMPASGAPVSPVCMPQTGNWTCRSMVQHDSRLPGESIWQCNSFLLA